MENFKFVYIIISGVLMLHLVLKFKRDLTYNFPFIIKKFGKESVDEKGDKYWILQLPFIMFVVYETKNKKLS